MLPIHTIREVIRINLPFFVIGEAQHERQAGGMHKRLLVGLKKPGMEELEINAAEVVERGGSLLHGVADLDDQRLPNLPLP